MMLTSRRDSLPASHWAPHIRAFVGDLRSRTLIPFSHAGKMTASFLEVTRGSGTRHKIQTYGEHMAWNC